MSLIEGVPVPVSAFPSLMLPFDRIMELENKQLDRHVRYGQEGRVHSEVRFDSLVSARVNSALGEVYLSLCLSLALPCSVRTHQYG